MLEAVVGCAGVGTERTSDAREVFLSVVLPAFNEADRIAASLRAVADYLANQPFASEIIVVDDGSIDGTAGAVREAATSLPVPLRLLSYPRNMGKGHALRVGFADTAGDRIVFMDVDLSTPPPEADKLLREIDRGCDVVLGSRKMAGSVVSIRQPLWRETMGRAFTSICRMVIANVSDVSCGF